MSPWTEHDTNWPSVLHVPMNTLDEGVAWAANTAVPPPVRSATRAVAPARIRILIWRPFRSAYRARGCGPGQRPQLVAALRHHFLSLGLYQMASPYDQAREAGHE